MQSKIIKLFGLLLLSMIILLGSIFSSVYQMEDKPFSRARAEVLQEDVIIPFQAGFPRVDSGSTIDYASPSVVDLDRDGELEILTADGHGCVWAWNHNGTVTDGFPLTTLGDCDRSARIHGPLAIGDIDGDGKPEIAAGTRGTSNVPGERGKVFVWNPDGTLLPGWPREIEWNTEHANTRSEVRSVVLGNIIGDESLEVIAGTTNSGGDAPTFDVDTRNLYVYAYDGSVLPGFPTWYRKAGIFGFVGAADLICDDHDEVIVGRDHVFLHAYRSNGQPLNEHWPVLTYVDANKAEWGEDLYMEFTHNAPAMADLDGDGIVEIVIAGKVRDPLKDHATITSGVLVFEPSGKRRLGWEVAKLGNDVLSVSEHHPSQAPALADLDGDGDLEIVVTLRDGLIHVLRQDGSHMWTYDFAQGYNLYGSEPVIGDISGDGRLDIVFGTYSPDNSASERAGVIALDREGNLLDGFPLQLTLEGTRSKQGVRAAPTLADLDSDGDVEIIAASWAGILYVWDLPSFFQQDLMPWPTGRHDNRRSGFSDPAMVNAVKTEGVSTPWPLTDTLYLPIIIANC